MFKSSITDKPRNLSSGENDQFGIEPFEKGLTQFINNSNTPITVALQGEWGSGKTSLMNSLKKKLSDEDESKFHSIWLNTWEYALMKDAQSTLMDIISSLIERTSEIANIDEAQTKKLLNSLWGGIKKTGKVVAKNTMDKAVSGAGSIVNAFDSDKTATISDIRIELEKNIEACIEKDGKKGFVFFIDDLDRIDPPVAVQLLELLKNIFTLKNCVFVLAIDYDVVIKGLEPKFGEYSEQNEREFRSFFDKIIQVPFAMPVSNYNVDEFLKESLLSINYLTEKHANTKDLISKFSEISNLSAGKNPRALKRLMNSLSLISCINFARNSSSENDQLNENLELLVNFALVSIQIAYPQVYRLLTLHPGFDRWDENVALQMNLKTLDEHSVNKLNQSEEFDEDWEKVLFRLCENDHYLKKQALNISRLLNSLKVVIKDNGEEIEDTVGAIISLSSVTNLEAFDKPVVDYHKGNFLKHFRNLILPNLKKDLPEIASFISPQGRRVQSNAFIKLSKNDWGYWFKLHSHPFEGGVRLIIVSDKWVSPVKGYQNLNEVISASGLVKEFEGLESDYKSYQNEFSDYKPLDLNNQIHNRDGHFVLSIFSYLTLPNVDEFYIRNNVERTSKVMKSMYEFLVRLEEFKMKIEQFHKGE
jgi:GTPase SAR1 family protein